MDDKEKNYNFFTYSQSSFSVNSCKCQPGIYCFDFPSAPPESLDQSDTDWNRDSNALATTKSLAARAFNTLTTMKSLPARVYKWPGQDQKVSGQGIK